MAILRVRGSGKEFWVDIPAIVGPQGPKGDTGPQGPQGEKGDTGANGQAGYTPQKGTDYYTEEDKTEMVNRVLSALPFWTGGNY